MNTESKMIFEAYGTIYRGDKTEQDSKDYSMNLVPFMGIIHKLAKGTFDTDSDQDLVSKGELQGIFEVEVVDGHRQVVLTNDAIKVISDMHPELKDKFWECGKCKADYAGCGAAKHNHQENAEDASVQSGGAIDDITDIQMQSMNLLKHHGFHINKVSNAHAEQMGGPVVYMGKRTGAMHQVAEVDPQGMINDESPEEYLQNHVHDEDAEEGAAKPSYNAMTHLTQAANHIRHILQTNADDEAQVEHVIRMAQIILGPKSDHTDAEYRKMLEGLIIILNRFIVVPMN